MIYLLLVTFDLRSPAEEYDAFFDAMLSDYDHYHISDTCYLVDAASARPMRDRLKECISPTDRLFVTELIPQGCCGQLPDKAKAWLKDHLYKI